MSKKHVGLQSTSKSVAFAALSLAAASASYGALVVNQNLGNLGPGATPFSGTTLGEANDADTYSNGNSTAIWDQDYVYQFTTTQQMLISLTSNDPESATLDNDFFLLNNLATAPNGSGLQQATTVHTNLVTQNGSFGLQPPGTYYMSVDAWRGVPGGTTPPSGRAGAFAGTLNLAPVVAPAASDVVVGGSLGGNLGAGQVHWYRFTLGAAQPLSFDTEGTTLSGTNDTELFLYDAAGNLIGTDDDDGTGNLSVLNSGDELPATVAAGVYYLAFGAFNSVGSAGWIVTSTSTQTGAYNINGISIPEPTSLTLLALAGVGLVARRRRA